MSLRARVLSRVNQPRRRKWKLDTIHDLLKPEHQKELVEMVGDPSIPASVIASVLTELPQLQQAGITVNDQVIRYARKHRWEPQ